MHFYSTIFEFFKSFLNFFKGIKIPAKNPSIFYFCSFSGSKMNFISTSRDQKLKKSQVNFKSRKEQNKNVNAKMVLRKCIMFFGVTQKCIIVDYI